MSMDIIQGTNDKPVASNALVKMIDRANISGTLFVGYPIVNTPNGPHHIDALMVSPDHGVVVFDLVEGSNFDGYESRQDDSANMIEARLKMHRPLIERRKLRIPIHTLTFAPAINTDSRAQSGYSLANRTNLIRELHQVCWEKSNKEVFRSTLSALENVGGIRKRQTNRTVTEDSSRGARLKRLEDSIATLDAMQGRAVIETVNGVQRIRGLAGSGKTIVLALKAAYLHAQHPEWRIAVTFHTRSLKGHFRRLITNFSINQTGFEPNWDNLRIVNAWGAPGDKERDGIYCEFCRLHGLDYFDFESARRRFGKPEFRNVCKNAMEQFKKVNAESKCYDTILIDEAQDLPDAFLQICYELLHEPCRLTYAYDELQNLGNESLPSPEEIFGKGADGEHRVQLKSRGHHNDPHDLILEKCYRNSRPVLVTAHALGFGIYRQQTDATTPRLVQMFDNPLLWTDIGYHVQTGQLKDGHKVKLFRPEETSPEFLEDHSSLDDLVKFVCFEDRNEQAEWVANAIHEDLTSEELCHDDIVVINTNPLTTRNEVGPIRTRLLKLGVNSHVAGVHTSSDEFFKEHAKSVTFTGVHRAKGNEAGMVYIINAQDCYGGMRNVANIRNRLFVAITRSKAWVRVVGFGSKMKQLLVEFEQLKSQDFHLHFTYPTEQERQQMRIVHRDMTTAERELVRNREMDLRHLVADLDAGRLHLQDLDEEVVEGLQAWLGGDK